MHWTYETSYVFLSFQECVYKGPVVQRPISTNLRLNFNPGFFSFNSKVFSRIIFSILLRSSTHHIALILGYLNPALNNSALLFITSLCFLFLLKLRWPKTQKNYTIFFILFCFFLISAGFFCCFQSFHEILQLFIFLRFLLFNVFKLWAYLLKTLSHCMLIFHSVHPYRYNSPHLQQYPDIQTDFSSV